MASQVDQGLSELLTAEQLQLLAGEIGRVLQHGFGDVTITVNRGHVRFVKATLSHELPNGGLHSQEEEDSITPAE